MKKRKLLFLIVLVLFFWGHIICKISPVVKIVINNTLFYTNDNNIPKNYIKESTIEDNSPNIDATIIKKYMYKKIDESDLLEKDFIKTLDNEKDVKDKIYIIKQMLKFYDIEYDEADYYKVLQGISLEDYYTITQFSDRYIHYSFTIYYFDMDKLTLYYIHTDN